MFLVCRPVYSKEQLSKYYWRMSRDSQKSLCSVSLHLNYRHLKRRTRCFGARSGMGSRF